MNDDHEYEYEYDEEDEEEDEKDEDDEDDEEYPAGWDEDGFIPWGHPGSIEEYENQYLGVYY